MPLQPDEVLISFRDLRRLFFRNKKTYVRLGILVFCLAFSFLLFKQPEYTSEALFKEIIEKKDQSDFLKEFLKNAGSSYSTSPVISVMRSHQLMRQVVEELGLQAEIASSSFLARAFSNAARNLHCELGGQASFEGDFSFRMVRGDEERPIFLFIKFLDKDRFLVLDARKKEVANGALGEEVILLHCRFNLVKVPDRPSFKRLYPMTIHPWRGVVKRCQSHFCVRTSKSDKSVLQLTYSASERPMAAEFLNTLMRHYQEYLIKENKDVTQKQLAYFEKRKAELAQTYEKALEEHVAYLSSNIGEEGFMSLKQEIGILEVPKEEYHTKLYEVELELSRLRSPCKRTALKDKKELKDGSDTKSKKKEKNLPLSGQGGEVEGLPHESDYLMWEKKLHDANVRQDEMQSARLLSNDQRELEDLLRNKEEAALILDCLENEKDIPEGLSLISAPKTLASMWARQLKAAKQKLQEGTSSPSLIKELGEKKEKLILYCKELIEIASQKQKNAIEKTLDGKGVSSLEFQGLNPEKVQELYVNYNHELDAIEVNIKQMMYLKDQILNPEVEISSLSGVLSDEVSQQMIQKASLLALELRDDLNRSPKEHERLKESHAMQKKFLVSHIGQMIELQRLRAHLIREKILSLQSSSVHLLSTEKSLIEARLLELKERMKSLPRKWKMESELALKKEICTTMMEAVSQLEESKRISHNLFEIESKPIEMALEPLSPKAPHLVLYSSLIALIICSFTYFVQFVRFVLEGPRVSMDALQRLNIHVSGLISPYGGSPIAELSDGDLETLRSLSQFILSEKRSGGNVVTILDSTSTYYVRGLAELLYLKGCKVLIVDCTFRALTAPREGSGLIQYLKGEQQVPGMISYRSYDYIPSGGYNRHFVELLSRKAFSEILQEMKTKYDVVLVPAHTSPSSSEARVYCKESDMVIASAKEASLLSEFFPLRHWQEEKKRSSVSFVIVEERF